MLRPFEYDCPGLSGPDSRQKIGRVTFGDFLSCRERIVIPIFQRRYCWDDCRVVGWWNDVVRGKRDHLGLVSHHGVIHNWRHPILCNFWTPSFTICQLFENCRHNILDPPPWSRDVIYGQPLTLSISSLFKITEVSWKCFPKFYTNPITPTFLFLKDQFGILLFILTQKINTKMVKLIKKCFVFCRQQHNSGNVVVKKVVDNSTEVYVCIDGQQRLTTTSLLCAALRDAILRLPTRNLDDEKERKKGETTYFPHICFYIILGINPSFAIYYGRS